MSALAVVENDLQVAADPRPGIPVDPRLPVVAVEIEEPNRQHLRRCERSVLVCKSCRQRIAPEDLVLVNGHGDGHRFCAELWNFAVFDALDELKAQDEDGHDTETPKVLAAVHDTVTTSGDAVDTDS